MEYVGTSKRGGILVGTTMGRGGVAAARAHAVLVVLLAKSIHTKATIGGCCGNGLHRKIICGRLVNVALLEKSLSRFEISDF